MKSVPNLGWRLAAVALIAVVLLIASAYRLGKGQGIAVTSKGPVIQEVQKWRSW